MKISGALLPSFYELGFIVSDQLRAISMIDASFQFSNFRSKCIKFIFLLFLNSRISSKLTSMEGWGKQFSILILQHCALADPYCGREDRFLDYG